MLTRAFAHGTNCNKMILLLIYYYLFPYRQGHIPNVKNSWIEFTLENWLIRGERPRAYKHILSLYLIYVKNYNNNK